MLKNLIKHLIYSHYYFYFYIYHLMLIYLNFSTMLGQEPKCFKILTCR
jgi:hypothetical protein